MNEGFQKKLSSLENLVGIQRDSADYDDYMHGMLNGLIMAHSVFSEQRPIYYVRRRKPSRSKIRHKKKK